MNSPIYDTFIISAIIAGYCFAGLLWLIMAVTNIKWGTPNNFAGIGMVVLWLYYGYRNYHFFTSPGNVINEADAQMNYMGVLFADVVSFYMAAPYFKHLRNWVKRWNKPT